MRASPVCLSFTLEILCTNSSIWMDLKQYLYQKLCTLISPWRNALLKVFKLKDDFNLLFIQYCFCILSI